MKILACILQRAIHLALVGEMCPELPSSEEIAFKDALSALKKGLPLEIDYSSYYDSSNSLTTLNGTTTSGHPFGCACKKCFDIREAEKKTPTDLERVKAMLESRQIPYVVKAMSDVLIYLTVERGYVGFMTNFNFNMAGGFEDIGAFE